MLTSVVYLTTFEIFCLFREKIVAVYFGILLVYFLFSLILDSYTDRLGVLLFVQVTTFGYKISI